MYTFYYQGFFFFVFLGELSDPHYKSLHVLSLIYVIIFVGFFCSETISPYVFLILNVIQLSTGLCLLSAAILSKDKTSVSIQCKDVSPNSSVLSFDSFLDSASASGIEFSLTYSISKPNDVNPIAHLSILDVMTLGNSFLGLNINGLWSLLKIIFFQSKVVGL